MSNWIVIKYGGTSVSSLENWNNIESVLRERLEQGYRVCLVHSALSGVSNLLERLLEQAVRGDHKDAMKEIKDRHLSLAESLDIDGEEVLSNYFEELKRISTGIALVGEASPRIEARVMSLGELMATTLSHTYLQQQGLECGWTDAREWLHSEREPGMSEKTAYLSTRCTFGPDEETRKFFEQMGSLVITQGFIARNDRGETVLLGRGGSDVSAAYFASILEAERLEIWTDVPGMFTADPRTIPSSRLIKTLTYEEAQEIATNGASVLHPRSILPVQQYKIPVDIRCTQRPNLEGTRISGTITEEHARVKAIAMRTGIKLVTLETVGMWQQVGFLAEAFDCFRKYGLSVDLVSTSETSVTISLDPGANQHFEEVRDRLKADLEELCNVRIIDSAAAVSLLGRQIRAILHKLGPTFEVFENQQIYLVSQAANDLNFTVVVDEEQAPRLVKQLHELLIRRVPGDQVLGSTWEDIFEQEQKVTTPLYAWWRENITRLKKLADREAPIYVYHKDSIQKSMDRLTDMESVDQVFYAVKANNNREVLELVYEEGLGFECVSPGEIEWIKELFPDLDPSRILFTPNFAPRHEYEYGIEEDVWLTVDNLFVLEQWPELFEDEEIFLRIDPGEGRGHHEHVRTGGQHSKFGIPLFEIDQVAERIEEIGASVVGLHSHSGSGILHHENWKNIATVLAELTQTFPSVERIDIGGGLGVSEQPGQSGIDLSALDEALQSVKNAYPDLSIWMEPGRYIVASAGALLTKVTQLKGKGEVKYVGVNTGMNSLIRPALYGAYHPIVNLSRMDEETVDHVNIVGPICETGDKLGIDRRFPVSEEGDIILIGNAGAYGRVMSSSYNMRQPAPEKVI